MGRGKSIVKIAQTKEDKVDIDYLPRGRFPRRRPIFDEFDRECGYAYDHELVFVRYSVFGAREYECGNCGHRVYLDDFSCDPDIHEMLEVGALELAHQPVVGKSRKTLNEMVEDRASLARFRERRRRRTLDEEERDA